MRSGEERGAETGNRGGALWPWVALVLLFFAALFYVCDRGERPAPVEEDGAPAREGSHSRAVVLYFAGPDGEDLVPERREIFIDGPDREAFAVRLLHELAGGPLTAGAWRTVPPELAVRSVFFDHLGDLYVDLNGESLSRWSWGTSSEILAIRSVVRTLAGVFPGITRVGLLVDGSRVESLGGHVDALYPFEVSEW